MFKDLDDDDDYYYSKYADTFIVLPRMFYTARKHSRINYREKQNKASIKITKSSLKKTVLPLALIVSWPSVLIVSDASIEAGDMDENPDAYTKLYGKQSA